MENSNIESGKYKPRFDWTGQSSVDTQSPLCA